MNENNEEFQLIDYFLIILKWKKFLFLLGVCLFVLSYLSIYFFVKPQYDSTSLLIPAQQEQLGGLGGILKNFSSLPIGLGSIGENTSIERFNTIIYSRTNLDHLIKKFDLLEDYNLEKMKKAEERLSNNITTDITKENAFSITVRANSPQKASIMVNYIVDKLNNTYVELNVRKSKDNRIFLESRYNEIKKYLKFAEDSLKNYQKRSGVLDVESQVKTSIEEFAKLDADLALKQIELSVIERIYGKNSPRFKKQRIGVEEFDKKITKIKNGADNNTLLLSLKSLPTKAVNYLRHYRRVKIYTSMLEFIIPLYEKAKFEEQKNIPILQIIDEGIPPEKKSYPPRILFSLLFTFIILLLIIFIIVINERLKNTNNPKLILLKKELTLKKNENSGS